MGTNSIIENPLEQAQGSFSPKRTSKQNQGIARYSALSLPSICSSVALLARWLEIRAQLNTRDIQRVVTQHVQIGSRVVHLPSLRERNREPRETMFIINKCRIIPL